MTNKGTHLTEEVKEKIRQKLLGRRVSIGSEFCRGHIPFNKGTKGLTKANKTSFKKGQMPHNFMGYYKICSDGIYILATKGQYSYYRNGKQIRVGRYEKLARKKWRDEFGEIPKGMIVFHKDKDIYNDNLDNLELISRAELLKRNQKTYKKICVICGLEFETNLPQHKTCSKICNKEYSLILNKGWAEQHKEEMRFYKRNYKKKIKNRQKLAKLLIKPKKAQEGLMIYK